MQLYQDGHVGDDLAHVGVPASPQDDCFATMYQALCTSQRLIYITGWALWVKMTLLRHPYSGATLGDLLVGPPTPYSTPIVPLYPYSI